MKFSSFSEFKEFVSADAFRYIGTKSTGKGRAKNNIRLYLTTIGFRYTFWMRLCCYLRTRKYLFPIYCLSKLLLTHLSYKSGIRIDCDTRIDKGLYIGHWGCIGVNSKSILGKNVNISQMTGISQANRGKNEGTPIIGDNVYIGPGARIIGTVHIGNNVCIGANAVVTHDVPDNAVVGGVSAKIISMDGAEGYVNNRVQ